jgi:hypothetical protein
LKGGTVATVTTRNRRKNSAPAPLYVCVETFTGDAPDGEPVVCRRGDEFAGDSVPVRQFPQFFAPTEAGHNPPPAPIPDYTGLEPEPYDAQVNSLPVSDPVRLREPKRVHLIGGPIVALDAGTTFDSNHELVRQHPDWFEAPDPEPER